MTITIGSKLNGTQGALQVDGVDSVVFDGNGLVLPSINGGQIAGFRNRIINGNFGINQRGVVSPVTSIAVGQYAHDRWCGGTASSAYSFSTTANVTTITITSGTIKQVIEGLNLETGTYTLSWTGTAQGKIGAGSYGASGITGSITGGTNTTIEFGPGTVSKVQLEFGSVASTFEQRPYGMELALCQRYYFASRWEHYFGATGATYQSAYTVNFPVTMRSAPTISVGAPTINELVSIASIAALDANVYRLFLQTSNAGNARYGAPFTATAEL